MTIICVLVGLVSAGVSCAVMSSVDAGEVYAELRSNDSAYITAYGFPFGYWVPDDSYAGVGSHKSRFLWDNFVADAVIFTVLAFLLLAPSWLLTIASRRRSHSSHASSASNKFA